MWKTPSFWILLFLTTLSWGSWLVVINNISPYDTIANQTRDIAFASFYLSTYLSVSFTSAIFLSLLWKIFIPTSSYHSCIKVGLREGLLLGLAIITYLVFLKEAQLPMKEFLLISSFFLLIELFFIKSSKIYK